ncbi:MAG TPA: TPM domain-containing protein [Chitinophagaceae bacterium]|nr:TPM domain-containing protein [Chitinophagaceae bacterium]MCB9056845.1 TPM domain-containing protein [Chitinophagales bacterium]HPG12650.1 TPM domain-containing protein [Chitinophagaceae bacterium]HRX93333.1 TPM domain-containing protein [Chitinophagaceae bacterium]
MFPFFRKKNKFFSDEDAHLIVKAIRQAEKRTSGEVRVFVESKCRWMDAIDRAAELFFSLKMEKTEQRNAVLVYIAMKDHQLAVFGDEGIHNKVGTAYWNNVVAEMISSFNKNDYAKGIAECVIQVGDALTEHFPYDSDTDKNELPDDIVFGH